MRSFGHPEKFEEAKEWYDGYRFGNNDIFNPWSILTYVEKKFNPGHYWINTSYQNIVRKMITSTNEKIEKTIRSLAENNKATSDMTEHIIFDDLYSEEPVSLLTVLCMSGYLTAVKNPNGFGSYTLSIPNREIGYVFAEEILAFIDDAFPMVSRFVEAMLRDDVDFMTQELEEMMSYHGYLALTDENSYRNIISGMSFSTVKQYDVSAEKEEGNGRSDILFKRSNGGSERHPNVIIEMKLAKDNEKKPEKLEQLALNAIEQIKDRRYYRDLKGKTILYGIVMDGKIPTIRSETLYL